LREQAPYSATARFYGIAAAAAAAAAADGSPLARMCVCAHVTGQRAAQTARTSSLAAPYSAFSAPKVSTVHLAHNKRPARANAKVLLFTWHWQQAAVQTGATRRQGRAYSAASA